MRSLTHHYFLSRPLRRLLALTLLCLLGASPVTLSAAQSPLSAAAPQDANANAQPLAPAAPDGFCGDWKDAGRQAPAMFIENVGQFPASVRFQAWGGDSVMWLTNDAIWLTATQPTPASSTANPSDPLGDPARLNRSPAVGQTAVTLKLGFDGANPAPVIEPFDALATRVSYYRGADQSAWRSGVPVWGGLRYRDLYPGIDLELPTGPGAWAPRLVARPGADLDRVRLRVDGALGLTLDDTYITMRTAWGELSFPLLTVVSAGATSPPTPLLEGEGGRTRGSSSPDKTSPPTPLLEGEGGRTVASPFLSSPPSLPGNPRAERGADGGDGGLGPSQTFGLAYNTFLGGVRSEEAWSVAVDRNGAAYVAGFSNSPSFSTVTGARPVDEPSDCNCADIYDAFVAKLSPSGSALLYLTLLHSPPAFPSRGDDRGAAIAVDDQGRVYVAGHTTSTDFPVTPDSLQPAPAGARDGFIARLDSAGALTYSSYFGGSHDDQIDALWLDRDGFVQVAGMTASSNFPTQNAVQPQFGGYRDGFVARFRPGLTSLVYSTYLGGGAEDRIWAITADSSGAYVTGYTQSGDFPLTQGAYRAPGAQVCAAGSCIHAFVTKLAPDGSRLIYSALLGGTGATFGRGIGVDASGGATVAGYTDAVDYPTTPGAAQGASSGGWDAFVTRLRPGGDGLFYSTYLGGGANDQALAVAIDPSGAAHVVGSTTSTAFPTTDNAFQKGLGGGSAGASGSLSDIFYVRLNPTGTGLEYGSYLGGNRTDIARAVALDRFGSAYLAGVTESRNFPTTNGAFQPLFNQQGCYHAFAARFGPDGVRRYQLFLPLIQAANPTVRSPLNPSSITGLVTEGGQPAPNVPVELWAYDTVRWTRAYQTRTDAAGRYENSFYLRFDDSNFLC